MAFRRQQYHETDATEQRITGRYTAAIDQLGSDKRDVRIGGIYALERIVHDSQADRPAVMDVLATFIREHTRPDQDTDTEPDPVLAQWMASPRSAGPGLASPWPPAADVQAALTVLARRTVAYDTRLIDLIGADLYRAHLTGAHLIGANLTDAYLDGAQLVNAKLSGADLSDALLTRANLSGVDLPAANVFGFTYDETTAWPEGFTPPAPRPPPG